MNAPDSEDVQALTHLTALIVDAAGVAAHLAHRWNIPGVADALREVTYGSQDGGFRRTPAQRYAFRESAASSNTPNGLGENYSGHHYGPPGHSQQRRPQHQHGGPLHVPLSSSLANVDAARDGSIMNSAQPRNNNAGDTHSVAGSSSATSAPRGAALLRDRSERFRDPHHLPPPAPNRDANGSSRERQPKEEDADGDDNDGEMSLDEMILDVAEAPAGGSASGTGIASSDHVHGTTKIMRVDDDEYDMLLTSPESNVKSLSRKAQVNAGQQQQFPQFQTPHPHDRQSYIAAAGSAQANQNQKYPGPAPARYSSSPNISVSSRSPPHARPISRPSSSAALTPSSGSFHQNPIHDDRYTSVNAVNGPSAPTNTGRARNNSSNQHGQVRILASHRIPQPLGGPQESSGDGQPGQQYPQPAPPGHGYTNLRVTDSQESIGSIASSSTGAQQAQQSHMGNSFNGPLMVPHLPSHILPNSSSGPHQHPGGQQIPPFHQHPQAPPQHQPHSISQQFRAASRDSPIARTDSSSSLSMPNASSRPAGQGVIGTKTGKPHPRRGAVPLSERHCSECGKPGRYKDGRSVEKWGPGPEGPGTVCDKCRKKMKRNDRRILPDGSAGSPIPGAGSSTPARTNSAAALGPAALASKSTIFRHDPHSAQVQHPHRISPGSSEDADADADGFLDEWAPPPPSAGPSVSPSAHRDSPASSVSSHHPNSNNNHRPRQTLEPYTAPGQSSYAYAPLSDVRSGGRSREGTLTPVPPSQQPESPHHNQYSQPPTHNMSTNYPAAKRVKTEDPLGADLLAEPRRGREDSRSVGPVKKRRTPSFSPSPPPSPMKTTSAPRGIAGQQEPERGADDAIHSAAPSVDSSDTAFDPPAVPPPRSRQQSPKEHEQHRHHQKASSSPLRTKMDNGSTIQNPNLNSSVLGKRSRSDSMGMDNNDDEFDELSAAAGVGSSHVPVTSPSTSMMARREHSAVSNPNANMTNRATPPSTSMSINGTAPPAPKQTAVQ